MSYYTHLGVSQSASDAEIKSAYRALVTTTHPDKGGSAEEFRKIKVAFEAIKTPEKRAEYDTLLRNRTSPQASTVPAPRSVSTPAYQSPYSAAQASPPPAPQATTYQSPYTTSAQKKTYAEPTPRATTPATPPQAPTHQAAAKQTATHHADVARSYSAPVSEETYTPVARPRPETSSVGTRLATAALVCGALSFTGLGFLATIAAVILGIMGRKPLVQGQYAKNRWMGTVGIGLGILGLIVNIVVGIANFFMQML